MPATLTTQSPSAPQLSRPDLPWRFPLTVVALIRRFPAAEPFCCPLRLGPLQTLMCASPNQQGTRCSRGSTPSFAYSPETLRQMKTPLSIASTPDLSAWIRHLRSAIQPPTVGRLIPYLAH